MTNVTAVRYSKKHDGCAYVELRDQLTIGAFKLDGNNNVYSLDSDIEILNPSDSRVVIYVGGVLASAVDYETGKRYHDVDDEGFQFSDIEILSDMDDEVVFNVTVDGLFKLKGVKMERLSVEDAVGRGTHEMCAEIVCCEKWHFGLLGDMDVVSALYKYYYQIYRKHIALVAPCCDCETCKVMRADRRKAGTQPFCDCDVCLEETGRTRRFK